MHAYELAVEFAMDMSFVDHNEAHVSVDERRPLWPAFVIAIAVLTTLLWTSTLLWVVSRILFSGNS